MSGLGDKVRTALQSEYQSGGTYQSIAKAHGISFSYVRGIILGVNPPGGLTLDIVERMFPAARLELDPGSAVPGASVGSMSLVGNHSIQQVGCASLPPVASPSPEEVRASMRLSLFQSFARLEICPECKAKVLAILAEA